MDDVIKKAAFNIFESSDNDCVYDLDLLSFVKKTVLPNKKMIPPLFRYSPVDYYNIRGLETQTLFLSPLGYMNDVFEGLSCKVTDKVLKNMKTMSQCAYLKSFSEENENLLMWAHYADSYTGMCVKYDFSNLCDDILYHLFPVFYSDKKMKNSDFEYIITELRDLQKANEEMYLPCDTDFLKDIMYLFMVKAKSWGHEKEWRLIATYPQLFNSSEDIGDEDVSEFYKLNDQSVSVRGCIKAVYLGPRIEKIKRKHIMEICRESKPRIPVYYVELSHNDFALEFHLSSEMEV